MKEPFLKQKWFNSKILFVICLFVLFFFSINLMKEFINRQGLNKEVSDLKKQMNDLNKDNTDLTSLIEQLKNLNFVEEEARTKLSLKKPGESVLIVPEDSLNGQDSLVPLIKLNDSANQTTTNPQKWWKYFFNSI